MEPTSAMMTARQSFLLVLLGVFVAGIFFARPRSGQSNFKLREADRVRHPDAGSPKATAKAARLLLEGFSPDGAPHEILKLKIGAAEKEIQSAYRKLMKIYHPDKIGPPGSREWTSAQAIASKITWARDEMLKHAKK